MIQDIKPHKFDNRYCTALPSLNDFVLVFSQNKILLYKTLSGEVAIPHFSDFIIMDSVRYLFRIDSWKVYYAMYDEKLSFDNNHMDWYPFEIIYSLFPQWIQFTCITAKHLINWYSQNQYCGQCGTYMKEIISERALHCPHCQNVVYPTISPVVIVGVIDGERLLLTKYAQGSFKEHGLIAGYVEIGETLEAAAAREVMEEVGIKIKNLKYFGSQPWGITHILIAGFFAELDGSNKVHLDDKELSKGKWFCRSELPHELSDISITYEMIEAFRKRRMN